MNVAPLLVERMRAALDAHDLDAFVEFFHEDYIGERPRHPDSPPSTREDVRENWAEVTEGTAAAWERARYEWGADRVTVTTRESKLFGAGGGWVFALTADDGGTKVDVELTREPHNVKQRLLAAALPLVGVGPLRKSFEAALKGQ